jgi:hypothetical protein
MRADGDNDGKTSAFRCLDAARYTVAAVVTVLIVAVVVTSLKVVLRPESLRLSVVDGAVYSTPHPANEAVTLQLNLRAENPSGRARMYFLNVTAYLFDSATPATTPKPDEDCIIFFNPIDEAVRQEMAVDLMTSVEATNDPGVMNQTYFELLYNTKGGGGVIGDMTLRVDGSLVTEVSSGFNMTRLQVTYYCRPLLVGGSKGGEASMGRKDVICTDNLGSQ